MRLRRAGVVAGVVVGLGAPAASADVYTVTTTGDAGPAACAGTVCTNLRDAVDAANLNPGDDSIDLTGLSGTIRLTYAALQISPNTTSDALTITGPGAGTLAISGDQTNDALPNAGDFQVFTISNGGSLSGLVSISGVTITNGYDPSGGHGGGAIFDDAQGPLALTDVKVTDSKTDASSDGGGGIWSDGKLTLLRTTVSGNTSAGVGGGIYTRGVKYPQTTLTDSSVSHNSSDAEGGGIYARAPLTLAGSTVSGNTAVGDDGGGIFVAKYKATLRNTTISGNTADSGGGLYVRPTYAPIPGDITIQDTTITANHAQYGAGLDVAGLFSGHMTIARSAITGNVGDGTSYGGGMLLGPYIFGRFEVLESTVSGNTADTAAGVALGPPCGCPIPLTGSYDGTNRGSIDFDNSTIAGNTAASKGGGMYLSSYTINGVERSATIGLTSTVVADNTKAGAPEDLYRVPTSTTGGFDTAFSLVEQPSNAPLTKSGPTTTGTDPQLGALANNGGPTLTMFPAGTSPLLDQGKAPANLTVDQRGQPRTVDTALGNASGGDGTDIGAVEVPADQVVIPKQPPPPQPKLLVGVRGIAFDGAARQLLAAGSTPVGCGVTLGTLTSCVIHLRTFGATTVRRATTTTLPRGTLLAEGAATSTGAQLLSMRLRLTSAGKRVLRTRPLGIDTIALAVPGGSSASGAVGAFHLLAGPRFVLKLKTRSATLPAGVLAQLDKIAGLLAGAKSVTCTGHTSRGRNDVAVSAAQAANACVRIKAAGFQGATTSVGAGHARPASKRLVITFRY